MSASVRTFVPGHEVDDAFVAIDRVRRTARSGTLEASRLARGRVNQNTFELNGSAGSIAFDLERFDELLVSDGGPYRIERVTGDWWPPGHGLGWGDTFTLEYAHLARARSPGRAPSPRTARRSRTATAPRRSATRSCAPPRAGEREDRLPMKTSLGIWALGPMVTRFVPGGYQPERRDEPMPEKVRRAVTGLGDLMDDYEFHYPGELNRDNLDAVRSALDGHGIYAIAGGLHVDERFRRGGLTHLDDAVRTRRCGILLEAADLAGDVGAQMIVWPGGRGLQLPVPDAVRRGLGALDRRRRAGRGAARASAASRSSSSTRTPSRR